MLVHVNSISHFFLRRKHPKAMAISQPPLSPAPPLPPPKDSLCDVMKPLPIPKQDYPTVRTPGHLRYPTHPLPARPRLSPEERLRRQLSTQRRHKREEEEALREEEERQARRRREKAESEQHAQEEEERRKALLKDELRQAAERKAREEHEARAAEERRIREIRELKQLEHERRLKYTRELQQWRSNQILRQESQSSEMEEERKRSADERRSRIASISDAVLQDSSAETFNGWVTVQTPEYLAWKRRYFKFDLAHGKLSLYRNQQDTARFIDLAHLDGRVESINEWYEGFEELESIPHSFAVKFVDGRTWLMFADTEQDKDRVLVLLSEAAGVIL